LRRGAQLVRPIISGKSYPSFRSLDPSRLIEQRHFQPLDFQQRPASDTLQVAIEARRRFDDAASLLLPDLRCLNDAGGKICRRDDLQHLEVVRARDLAVLNAGCLQDAIPHADRALALALVLEGRPAGVRT
jgi:hypothetical protein